MENVPTWVMLAGVLIAAVLMYMVAWRIVQGTHIVVRTVTRVLLGALIVVPAILFLLYGEHGVMQEKMAAPPPAAESEPADAARPAKKKAAAPPAKREAETGERVTEKSEAATEEEVAAAPVDDAAEDAPIAEEAAASDEEAASSRTSRKKPKRRSYRRSYSYKPPAAANGGTGGAGTGEGGSGPAGESGLGGLADETAREEAPGTEALVAPPEPSAPEPPPEVTAMPDASAPIDDGGTSGAAAPSPPAPPATTPPPESTAAAAVKEDWSVVPVYYGTDRARADKQDRIGYDWQRGRRLELGLAMVTIPKEHVVPMVERPWALKIPYVDIVLYEAAEDPKKHFTLKELKALTKEEFLDLVKQRLAKSARFKDHALVFVHGYKTTFNNAVYRTAQIAYDLKFDGAPFLYSWPSGGTLQGYTYDRESVAQSEIYLRQFLEMVRDETGAKKVSIIAHSMGNQLLLRTLQDMKRSMPEGVLISQLILAAPDVDRDAFQHIVKSIEGIAEGITLYAAANDTALAFSRQVNGGVPRAGDVPESGPIVMEGIDTIDATATSMDSVGINHSGYAENNALLEDIGKLVAAGVRPPGIRQPDLETVETDKGTYWRYPGSPD